MNQLIALDMVPSIILRYADNTTHYMKLLKKYHKTHHPCKRKILDTLAVRQPDDDDDDDDHVYMNVIGDLFSCHLQLNA